MIRVDELPEAAPTTAELVSKFLSLTQYGNSDLLAYSTLTRTFLTRNGGKYKLVGNEIEHLAGPSPDPSERI